MSESKHTPEKWHVGNNAIFNADSNCVASVYGKGEPGSTDRLQDRLALIAAAPDLFAELERVAGYLNQWNALHGSRGFLQADIERRLQSVRAVLAQGRGES